MWVVYKTECLKGLRVLLHISYTYFVMSAWCHHRLPCQVLLLSGVLSRDLFGGSCIFLHRLVWYIMFCHFGLDKRRGISCLIKKDFAVWICFGYPMVVCVDPGLMESTQIVYFIRKIILVCDSVRQHLHILEVSKFFFKFLDEVYRIFGPILDILKLVLY